MSPHGVRVEPLRSSASRSLHFWTRRSSPAPSLRRSLTAPPGIGVVHGFRVKIERKHVHLMFYIILSVVTRKCEPLNARSSRLGRSRLAQMGAFSQVRTMGPGGRPLRPTALPTGCNRCEAEGALDTSDIGPIACRAAHESACTVAPLCHSSDPPRVVSHM